MMQQPGVNTVAEDGTADARKKAVTVLVVEDDFCLRYTLAQWLRYSEYNVVEAASADEAVQILSSDLLTIDVVVTDYQMPGELNGGNLAEHIARNTPGLPVIMVSGHPDPHKLNEINVAKFFRKPYDFDHLVACIVKLASESGR
jgi:DNA-binding NtrC family response regulator